MISPETKSKQKKGNTISPGKKVQRESPKTETLPFKNPKKSSKEEDTRKAEEIKRIDFESMFQYHDLDNQEDPYVNHYIEIIQKFCQKAKELSDKNSQQHEKKKKLQQDLKIVKDLSKQEDDLILKLEKEDHRLDHENSVHTQDLAKIRLRKGEIITQFNDTSKQWDIVRNSLTAQIATKTESIRQLRQDISSLQKTAHITLKENETNIRILEHEVIQTEGEIQDLAVKNKKVRIKEENRLKSFQSHSRAVEIMAMNVLKGAMVEKLLSPRSSSPH